MMGFPCLRLNGDFFAGCDPYGDLVVKLDESAVSVLVDVEAEPFAPNGRRFREWASIPARRQRSWARILDEAFHLAAARTSSRETRRSARRGADRDTEHRVIGAQAVCSWRASMIAAHAP
jgi:hypothetical protein